MISQRAALPSWTCARSHVQPPDDQIAFGAGKRPHDRQGFPLHATTRRRIAGVTALLGLAATTATGTPATASEARVMTALALQGEAAPGDLGEYASIFSDVSAADDGHISWNASLTGPGFRSGAFIRDPSGSVRTILSGSAGPAALAGVLDAVFDHAVRTGGEIAFEARGGEP